MQKIKPIRDIKYLRWIASLPCIVSGATDVQCAHIRKGNVCGMGLKPCDSRVVPLSCLEHEIQHEMGELAYWYDYRGYERANILAKRLYESRYNFGAAIKHIGEWRDFAFGGVRNDKRIK